MRTLLHRPGSRTILITAALLGLAVLALTSPARDRQAIEPRVADPKPLLPLFANSEPASNPVQLSLLVDAQKVVGWISGTEDHAGKEVAVRVGEKTEKIAVEKGNTFAWAYKVNRPASVEFRVGDLRNRVTLEPAASLEPTVFFIVDRTVYRPGQPLQFAAFLRQLDERGEWAPLTNRSVEVHIRSERKNTLAAKLQLAGDAFGRIVGAYPFSDGDPLDNYILTVPGYKGTARVSHAEFRKSKIKLNIDGTVEGSKLKLTFQAVDFLEKPVPGSKVHFTAQVVRKGQTEQPRALKAEEFAYHAPGLPDFDDLPEEELLLFEAGGLPFPSYAGRGGTVVAQITGDIDFKGEKSGAHTIDLQKDWQQGNYHVAVHGVIVDQNGHEQRATQTVAIDSHKRRLQVTALKRLYEVNEPIEVKVHPVDDAGKPVQGPSTLVAMRLSAGAPVMDYTPWSNLDMGNGGEMNWNLPVYSSRRRGSYRSPYWNAVSDGQMVKRTLETATAFHDGVAEVKLTKPGAYKLVAITRLADGTELRSEVGCVVRQPEEMPALLLKLGDREYASGDVLTGELHSRFANARVLLTLRDSTGIRFWKPMQLDGTSLRISEKLPANLRYGCYVDVQYLDQADRVTLASKLIRVKPDDRMLTIETKTKEVYGPGEMVKLDLQVNRKEPVDLVVSVFDQALLGVAADKSADIRSFYLADERVRHVQAREILRRKLGDVTLKELLDRAEKLLKEDKALMQDPQGKLLQHLVEQKGSQYYYSQHLVALLRLAGVDIRGDYLNHPYQGSNWYYRFDQPALLSRRLVDILDTPRDEWRLTFHASNDTLFVYETHPSYPQGYMPYLFNQLGGFGYRNYGGYARGDARFSAVANGSWSVTGNSMFSVSGQAMISHMPAPGPVVELINADPDQSNILVRRDFSDSAFWHAAVRTDDDGKSTVEFKVPDSLTNWQVVVTAVSRDNHVGQAKSRFRTYKPIMVWPMLPRNFTEGDKVEVFASVHNLTEQSQSIHVRLKAENGEIITKPDLYVDVPAKSNRPVYWTFQAGKPGFTQLLMSAECNAGSDGSLKRLPVATIAAEQVVTVSGLCKESSSLRVPDGVDLTTASLEISFAPSLAADLVETLDYLVDYPYGCVEQTMSRFLPTIKVAQILKKFHLKHEGLEKKLPGCVSGGIKRLLELQQPDGGWGWNGNSQTHEMMTPYALYGLLQAEKAGYTIPNETAVQTGLQRLHHFIQNMGENQVADRIYCMYVYAHRHDITDDWWKFIGDQLGKDKLSDYAVALALEMAVQKQKTDLADRLAGKLRRRAQESAGRVYWQTAGFSRWGEDRHEITAAALKALVAYEANDRLIPGVLVYFTATKRGNRWNSTKDTAMIVYAMCDYLAKQDFNPQGKQGTTYAVNSGAAQKVLFDDGLTKKVVIPGTQLLPLENRFTFASSSPGVMYRAVLRYWQRGNEIVPMDKGIKVTRTFFLLDDKGQRVRSLQPGDTIPRGAYVESEVNAHNPVAQQMRYVLVEDRKPACCEIQPVEDTRFNQHSTHHVLREEKTAMVAYHHEETPATITNRCVLHAELAGEYIVPPASVEMMYQTETRGHSGTFRFKVVDTK